MKLRKVGTFGGKESVVSSRQCTSSHMISINKLKFELLSARILFAGLGTFRLFSLFELGKMFGCKRFINNKEVELFVLLRSLTVLSIIKLSKLFASNLIATRFIPPKVCSKKFLPIYYSVIAWDRNDILEHLLVRNILFWCNYGCPFFVLN